MKKEKFVLYLMKSGGHIKTKTFDTLEEARSYQNKRKKYCIGTRIERIYEVSKFRNFLDGKIVFMGKGIDIMTVICSVLLLLTTYAAYLAWGPF